MNLRKNSVFSVLDIIFITWSIITFFADVGTDFIVTVKYFHHGHYLWAAMTIGILIIPTPVIQIFSLRWCKAGGTITKELWMWHIIGFGVLKRYIDVLKTGFKIRKAEDVRDVYSLHQQQSDACMLRLFESFLESAPQLVLQLYIMISTNHWTTWTGISASASLISLSWGIAAYSKAMRNVQIEKDKITWFGLFLQTVWRIGMVSARITALVIFVIGYKSWIFFVMVIHWMFAFAWVTLQDTDFCETWWEEKIYNCVVAVIYCFCFFNIKEGKSRKRLALFYTIIFIENISILLCYYHYANTNNHYNSYWILQCAAGIIITCFFIGLLTMMLYYRYFHPSGPIPCPDLPCVKKNFIEKQTPEIVKSSNYCCDTIRSLKSNHHTIDPSYITPAVNNLCNSDSYRDLEIQGSCRELFHHRYNSLPSISINNVCTANHSWYSMPNLASYNYSKSISKAENSTSECDDITLTSEEIDNNSSANTSNFSNDSGLANVKSEYNKSSTESSKQSKSPSDSVHDLVQSPEIVPYCSLPHHEKLQQSLDLKKIKSQLGHSISFGDIPLFPPLKRKMNPIDDCNDNSFKISVDFVPNADKPFEVISNCSLPHHNKSLIEQSPDLKKIKIQLGHSISFGDIPLFPPLSRMKNTKEKSSCAKIEIIDESIPESGE